MRSSVTSNVVLAGLVAGLAAMYGCGGGESEPPPFTTTTAGSPGAAGAGTSGAPTGTAGLTGASGSIGTSGATATGGAPGTAGGSAGGASGAGGQSIAGASGSGGGSATTDITKVWKSDGCGKAFAGTSGAAANIQTMGTKDANCADKLGGVAKCGAFSLMREYRVFLPANYDPAKPYSLILQGPGCGGGSNDVYPLDGNVGGTAIRVGLSPPPNSVGHGTNENQGCFDDKEGDDSVDWAFYEALYDKLNADVCFDRNRLFSAGNSSGSWFSNELGCKYAGDAKRPVRGVMPNTGGLPTNPAWVPTCTSKPMAGMWIHEVGDETNSFAGNIVAIDRAMKLNKCAQQTYASAMFEPFKVGKGIPDTVCKRITGCDPLYPLVVCPLTGTGHGSHDDEVNAGFPTFVKLFSAPPLLTQ